MFISDVILMKFHWNRTEKYTNHKCTTWWIFINWAHLCNLHPDLERMEPESQMPLMVTLPPPCSRYVDLTFPVFELSINGICKCVSGCSCSARWLWDASTLSCELQAYHSQCCLVFIPFIHSVYPSVHGHFGSFEILALINKPMWIFLYVHFDTDGFILRSESSDVVLIYFSQGIQSWSRLCLGVHWGPSSSPVLDQQLGARGAGLVRGEPRGGR